MLPPWLLLVLVLLLAVVLRHGATINDDVSWCVTLAEKVLDGERLYVDVIEINPPATMFLYVVPALMGRLSGLPAKFGIGAKPGTSIGKPRPGSMPMPPVTGPCSPKTLPASGRT